MKGNKILKQISKILLSVCLVFAFLCSPVTKFFSKVSKVFAATPTLADVEGANVKVEGFTGTGKVGEKIKLPEVKVGSSTYNVKDTYGDLIYDVKTSSGVSVTNDETATAYLKEEGGIHYLYSNVEGVYTLDIHTVSDNKLTTIVKGLQINVSKADATLSMPNTAIVESGKTGIVLPEKISLEKLKSSDFKLAVPTIHESGEMDNVVVKCIPAGVTTADGYITLEAQKDTDNNITHYAFKAEDKAKLTSYGKYTFIYSYIKDGAKLCADVKLTCEVTNDNKYLDDVTLAMSTTITDPELKSGNIGEYYTLPTATVYNSKSGSTDSIPAVLTIKVTPASNIKDAKVELDGYKFKADTIGTYHVVYTANYPYSDKTVEKNFTVELKDEINPEVIFVQEYDRDAYFLANETKGEADFAEYLTEDKDASDMIKSVYVMQGDSVTINLPAIYAKDNSTDGNYTMTRNVTTPSNQVIDIEEANNKTDEYVATSEGVYTINYTVTDGNGKSSNAKKHILVVKEDTLKDINGVNIVDSVVTIKDTAYPKLTTAVAPRTIKSNASLTISVPTATDTLTNAFKEKFNRLKSSSVTWTSNVAIETKLVGYNDSDVEVAGATYTFTQDDIDANGKYTIDLQEKFTTNADQIAYFKLVTSASTDWMNALNLGSKTVESKIEYVRVEEDKEAATIALAEFDGQTTLAGILTKKNEAVITANKDRYNEKNGTSFNATILANGMLEYTDAESVKHYIAPFNQYSADNNQKVILPDLIITDKIDGTNLSVTGTITDSLGNTKTFVPDVTKVVKVAEGYSYYVTLGEFELTTAGQYTVSITAKDMGDNYSVYSFAVMVNDTTSPSDIILDADLVGESTISKTYYTGDFISFPEAQIVDNSETPCEYTAKLTRYPEGARLIENVYNSGFATLTAGTYEITYTCKDSFGNELTKVYSLEVTAKDRTTIIVNEDLFNDNFTYAFDESKNTEKIVIPAGIASNEYDTEINGKTIKPTVKNKNGVTQTVNEDGDNYTFNAGQGVYTITYQEGSVTKTYTIYVGDTDAPVLTWKEEVPSTLKLNAKWGNGIKDMFEITDVKNGEKSTISDYSITITNPDNAKKTIDGTSDYKFDKEGTYTITITFDDGVNEEKVTKTITVSSDTNNPTTNPTNVVGIILVIAAILVAGGLVVYLILSSRKNAKKKQTK